MRNATLSDRVLLLLSIKKKGKFISKRHVVDKVVRDAGGEVEESDVEDVIHELISEKLILENRDRGGYAITAEGMEELRQRLSSGIKNLNLSYLRVLKAREYYPTAARAILPFLKDRAASVVKVFSNPEDPIGKLKPLFVRYARYKPRPKHIIIDDEDDLLSLVDAHAIDFIPYVHRLNAHEPDWFILDLDAGEKFKRHPHGFELLKTVTGAVVDVLQGYGIEAKVKFSGSRGMQVWSWLDNEQLSGEDIFALYRNLAVYVQSKTEEALQELPSITYDKFYEIVAENKPITTSVVAKKNERRDQVLIDWSSMKPMGDVRAPFSIHYKTGYVSVPVDLRKLPDFTISEAQPEKVIEKIDELIKYFTPAVSDPKELLRDYKGGS